MKYQPLPSEFYKNTRKKLLNRLPQKSMAIVFANYQMPRNGDQYYAYRQNSDFFYLTGIEQEQSVLVVQSASPGKEAKEVLFLLRSNPDLEIWEGHKLTHAEATGISGIQTVQYIDELEQYIHSQIADIDSFHFNLPENGRFKPEVEGKDHHYAHLLMKKYPLHEVKRLAGIMHDLRLKKEPEELEQIRKACSITREAFLNVLHKTHAGLMEYEIEAGIIYDFIRQGASGHAYAPIIASGKNACHLHYTENDTRCVDGELLLMDFGAEYGNYAADLSRTIPVNGRFTKRQLDLYNATLRVMKVARRLMKPGTTINTYHKEICQLWEEEHIKLGLYSLADVKKHKGEHPLWYKYYMHGTSHFLGLDVHDVGNRDIVFEPGMVLTCEPGLYIAEESTGIRIENDILITEDGNIDLMADIPIEAEEIEALMNNK